MKYFLTKKKDDVLYYDTKKDRVYLIKDDQLYELSGESKTGPVHGFKTIKLLPGYSVTMYEDSKKPYLNKDLRLFMDYIEETRGIRVNGNHLSATISRIHEGIDMDEILKLYGEIRDILKKEKKNAETKYPSDIVCKIQPIQIEREVGNTNMNTFDFIRVQYSVLSGIKKEDIIEDVRKNKKAYVKKACEYISSQKQFQHFGVPVNILMVSKITLTHDRLLEFLFEVKKAV